jgi:hypothetical protein
MLRSVLSTNSRAENIPAGPAPTIITSKYIKDFSGSPKLHTISAIYVLIKHKRSNYLIKSTIDN